MMARRAWDIRHTARGLRKLSGHRGRALGRSRASARSRPDRGSEIVLTRESPRSYRAAVTASIAAIRSIACETRSTFGAARCRAGEMDALCCGIPGFTRSILTGIGGQCVDNVIHATLRKRSSSLYPLSRFLPTAPSVIPAPSGPSPPGRTAQLFSRCFKSAGPDDRRITVLSAQAIPLPGRGEPKIRLSPDAAPVRQAVQ